MGRASDMAEIQITVLYDGEEEGISGVLNKIAEATDSDDFGVIVDGEHRDPDEPLTGLFS